MTDGQKFIDLYCYPSFNDNLNFLRFDSLFVRAGSHTLLKDFNASFAADDAGKETILLEYCVNVYPDDEMLSLTFTPSLSHSNAYALINEIEVISMPTFLYYTNPDNQKAMILNGGNEQYSIKNNRALETLYRINVGGIQIPSDKDPGMFRYWDQDIAYLERGAII